MSALSYSIRSIIFLVAGTIGIVFLIGILYLFVGWSRVNNNTEYGVTFSREYAEKEFGLNADDVLRATLDDLGVRRFRIPAYWSILESVSGTWDFTGLDRDIEAIADRKGKIVLAVGEKLPRWPECWGPDWWKKLPRNEQRKQTLSYIETVVRRYANNRTITEWQVENEPHFAYGDCPKLDRAFLEQEITLVRHIDPTRPVVTTDSGELSLWVTFGGSVDALGISVYRVVKNPSIGIWRYWFVPPYFYKHKADMLAFLGLGRVYVSEFQMEPWSNASLPQTPTADQLKTFDLNQMKKNFDYATKMELSPIDFWGIEWWYWMKEKRNRPEFWEQAKTFFVDRTPRVP